MKHVTCTKTHGKHWAPGEGFAADVAYVNDKGRLVGRDIDGKAFNLPANKFEVVRSGRLYE